MSLTETLSRSIDSATYNPAAEKAAAERDASALLAKDKFKRLLTQVRGDIETLIANNTMATLALSKFNDLLKTNTALLTTTATAATWESKAQLLKDTETDLNAYNTALLSLEYIARTGPAIVDDMASKTNEKTSPETVTQLKVFFADLTKYTQQAATTKTIDLQNKLSTVKASLAQSIKQPYLGLIIDPGQAAAAATTQKQTAAKQKVEAEQFNLFRLLSTTKDITIQVVQGLFYVMICLVAGTLAANDAIGREIQYRILYFIYGFIFGPVVILYYLFRWFNKDAPHIYRMLPIFTTEAKTSLGQLFFYPFTYAEDAYTKGKYADFMKASAALTGSSVADMANAIKEDAVNASMLVKGVEGLTLGPIAAVASSQVAETILDSMKGLRVTNK